MQHAHRQRGAQGRGVQHRRRRSPPPRVGRPGRTPGVLRMEAHFVTAEVATTSCATWLASGWVRPRFVWVRRNLRCVRPSPGFHQMWVRFDQIWAVLSKNRVGFDRIWARLGQSWLDSAGIGLGSTTSGALVVSFQLSSATSKAVSTNMELVLTQSGALVDQRMPLGSDLDPFNKCVVWVHAALASKRSGPRPTQNVWTQADFRPKWASQSRPDVRQDKLGFGHLCGRSAGLALTWRERTRLL